ncbi:MAG: hypothetical protein HY035_09335 [Nitrospirae bacterium]|nr:hypothetical protein [Nitrospirota bacterium]MBI3378581.1 hypothetical protein [Nitrospirota bacterium]
MARFIRYECDECGCEVTVREMPETQLRPIYCCGVEVEEISTAKQKAVKTKKIAAKKKVAKKKKAVSKKKKR